MTARKTRKKPAAKRSPSNVAAAQRAAVERRLAREKAAKATAQPGGPTPGKVNPNDPAGRTLAQVQPKPAAPVKQIDGKPYSEAANKIAGLASGIMKAHQEEKRKLADTSLYGAAPKERATKLAALMQAGDQARQNQLKKAGNAVWMGPKIADAKLRNTGPERLNEDGSDTTHVGAVGDDIRNKDELMSWLADEVTFNQIKKRMNSAGIAAETYDDVSKIWEQVINQASAAYSTTGKKVTPWALLALRGKTMVGGKPASKTTVSTSIDDMDPASAKAMVNKLASDALGREATPEEVEDFIAKAQTIVSANPQVTTTTTDYNVAGDATSQRSHTTGGLDKAMNRAQQEAQDSLNQTAEHADYQAAGVIFPWFTDALASPV